MVRQGACFSFFSNVGIESGYLYRFSSERSCDRFAVLYSTPAPILTNKTFLLEPERISSDQNCREPVCPHTHTHTHNGATIFTVIISHKSDNHYWSIYLFTCCCFPNADGAVLPRLYPGDDALRHLRVGESMELVTAVVVVCGRYMCPAP